MLARKALAGTAGAPKVYVEDVFSTYLYTGNNNGQTITNNIDLSTEGGLVWLKCRSYSYGHLLCDTARGKTKYLTTNTTSAEQTVTDNTGISSFSSTGFVLGGEFSGTGSSNASGEKFASWTFRKAEKFFDVVTYTGNGTAGRTISHNLGSTPGCIIVKNLTNSRNWNIYHRSAAKSGYTAEQSVTYFTTSATTNDSAAWNDTAPTSTVFTVGADLGVNASSNDYVAYLFAHDAGGFGDAGSDNVITCGSFNNSTRVELGYEPQWIMCKSTSGAGSYWWTQDSMRSMSLTNTCTLAANLSDAETNWGLSLLKPDATGFTPTGFGEGDPYIFIAIRRGPMKTPTTGTSVYTGTTRTGTGASAAVTGVGFPPDLVITRNRPANGSSRYAWYDKLRGATKYLDSAATDSEFTVAESLKSFDQDGETLGTGAISNYSGDAYINWQLRRAPGFFDVVCYTGTGSATTISHNLGVVPELMIVKRRSTTNAWAVYANNDNTDYLVLNTNAATVDDNTYWNDTSPTSSVFSVGTNNATNASGSTYVAYLFASLSGVSKVGSYTGNGSSVTVTTDFQPRFILVKRTDSTGDWIVSDSARGLVAGNDPYLLLNSAAAEDTDEDWVDVSSTGFTVNETTANANVNTGTYLYLAVA